ncbi:hypothetical protein F4776DRAFT_615118 [Hypoxylon sp. NC0597]|nr:hypothetical protein F4776DRAFT_615118 [Hypoxylon sp. NC0597]
MVFRRSESRCSQTHIHRPRRNLPKELRDVICNFAIRDTGPGAHFFFVTSRLLFP